MYFFKEPSASFITRFAGFRLSPPLLRNGCAAPPIGAGMMGGGEELDLRDFSYYGKVITDMKKFLNNLLTVILLGARILNSLSAMNDELAKVDLTDSQKK